MVRTGARARALEALLVRAGLRPAPEQPPSARIDDLPSDAAGRVVALYRQLGGQDEPARFRPGKWDLAFEHGLVIELDEQLHFNRYRALTLAGEWARLLPWRDEYLTYCRDREADCLADGRWGQRWTNPSCEKLFGPADPPGTFHGAGAPRWKQRALYDAMKDAAALASTAVRLARLAVYDKVEGIELGAGLEGQIRIDPAALASFVDSRLAAK